MPIRLVVVSAHELYRDCFTILLEADAELCLAGVVATGREAVDLVIRERPDAIVLVVAEEDAAPVLPELAAHAPVLVVGSRDEDDAACALAAGARGVVGVRHGRRQLLEAIRVVARGETYATGWALPDGGDGDGDARLRAYVDPLGSLTPRERQVFARLIEGDTNVEIAERLGISPKTVDSHRTHVMRKIGVHSAVQLVRFAARHRLFAPEPPTLRA